MWKEQARICYNINDRLRSLTNSKPITGKGPSQKERLHWMTKTKMEPMQPHRLHSPIFSQGYQSPILDLLNFLSYGLLLSLLLGSLRLKDR